MAMIIIYGVGRRISHILENLNQSDRELFLNSVLVFVDSNIKSESSLFGIPVVLPENIAGY